MQRIWFTILIVLIISVSGHGQEKIKGNKNVTTVESNLDDFKKIRFGDKLEIELVKGNNASVVVEADENLHDVIIFSVQDSILNMGTSAKIQSSKRLNIKVYYTESLHSIEIDDDAELSAVETFENEKLELRINDFARAFINVKNAMFKLVNHNRSTFGISSKSKLNIESSKVDLALGQNSKTEALVVSDSLVVNAYENAYAKIEGESQYLNLDVANDSEFSSKNLALSHCDLISEGSSEVAIQVIEELKINASGKSEIQIYGDPKITLIAFKDTSSIHKKRL